MKGNAAANLDMPLLFDGDIIIPIGSSGLHATLTIPRHARGLVISTHGCGINRYSPRYRSLALGLNGAGFATLLVDLLTDEEDALDRSMAQYRFEVNLLGSRLQSVTEWARRDGALSHLPIGYLGSGTGSAAALIAAAALPSMVLAVISKGGRPDMARDVLHRTTAATLLLAGEMDEWMIPINREALNQMDCEKKLVVVRGASQQFEEAGALQSVERLCCDWFDLYLDVESVSPARFDSTHINVSKRTVRSIRLVDSTSTNQIGEASFHA